MRYQGLFLNKHLMQNKIGMEQTKDTCWFNSVINNFFLSEYCYEFFMNKYLKESKYFEPNSPKYHFYNYFQMYRKKSSPKNLFSKTWRSIKTRNDAECLINKLGIREPGWLKDPTFHSHIILERILPIIMDKSELESFIFLVTHKIDKDVLEIREAPPKGFQLDHVVITIYYNDLEGGGGGHGIAGYRCNDCYYIYDSNFSKSYEIDWRYRKNVIAHLAKKYRYAWGKDVHIIVGYSYICYTRVKNNQSINKNGKTI